MPRVLIAGGGFGGYYTAQSLERHTSAEVEILLVNDSNFMLYSPLLPGAAAGTLEPRHVAIPLRERLRRTQVELGWVRAADPAARTVTVERASGEREPFTYDHLVVALGSITRTVPVPGLTEHAVGLKTLAEGIALRNQVVRRLEVAEELADEGERREHLGFVFVGGGYAGLEGAAELQSFADDVLKYYPRCAATGMRWLVVDAADRIMPQISPRLAHFTEDVLRQRGIELLLNTQLTEVTARSVTLSTGEVVPCRTVCWTAGVTGSPVAGHLGLPVDRGRIECDATMRVKGVDNVWAVGDVAAIPDPARPGQPCPATAQHAIRQGKLLGRNLAAVLGSDPGEVKPFAYKTLGMFADLGRHNAVAEAMGIPLRGFPAWALCRFYHLAWVPGLPRKLRLIADWTVDFWFRRDIAELGQLGHPPRLQEHTPPPER
ncbi:MAG TPA: NAD(P)/FAD-dependent oxidoreductase [Solirubrobacteraceae bacterium]|nr:NAD(P)/FAD-dependent oxidoreductase [Solirubrobacteraceae bacterium]